LAGSSSTRGLFSYYSPLPLFSKMMQFTGAKLMQFTRSAV
jgi:hypothetical protein